MTIPKIIHYCWFGNNPLSSEARKCKESWERFFPDYEIREWNEENFDVFSIPYAAEAYEAKKYAFVSDYARFKVLYDYGGIYFDTDVEVIKSMDKILRKGPFLGVENENGDVNPGLGLCGYANMDFFNDMIEVYSSLHFVNKDGTYNKKTIVDYTTEVLLKKGLMRTNEIQYIAEMNIYPVDYFCPISTSDGLIRLTENTVSIHHFAQSWQPAYRRLARDLILQIGGVKLKRLLKMIFRL